jgi:hypothetical protein
MSHHDLRSAQRVAPGVVGRLAEASGRSEVQIRNVARELLQMVMLDEMREELEVPAV